MLTRGNIDDVITLFYARRRNLRPPVEMGVGLFILLDFQLVHVWADSVLAVVHGLPSCDEREGASVHTGRARTPYN